MSIIYGMGPELDFQSYSFLSLGCTEIEKMVHFGCYEKACDFAPKKSPGEVCSSGLGFIA